MLLYVEARAGTPTATVGAWDGDALAPITRIALPDSGAAAAVLDFAAEARVDRFGPVAQVVADAEDGLVVEIAFSDVERAPRRRSGVALRRPRLVRVSTDIAPADAARLEDVRALLR